jgi:hypothetical protein
MGCLCGYEQISQLYLAKSADVLTLAKSADNFS